MVPALLLCLLSAGAAAPPDADAGEAPRARQSWAVVVGVSGYEVPAIPRVPHAVADAEAIRDWLTTAGGVPERNVLMLTDGGQAVFDPAARPERVAPSRRNLRLAFGPWLRGRVGEGDRVIVYFAGQAAAEGAEPLLLPSDAHPEDLAGTALSAAWLARTLGDLPARAVLCWYDTGLGGRGQAFVAPKETRAALRAMVPGRQGAVWLASAGLAPAAEGATFHGAFTEALLAALRAGGTVGDAWKRLRAKLPKEAPEPARAGADLAKLPIVPDRAPTGADRPPELIIKRGHTQRITRIVWDPQARFFATSSEDTTAKVWDARTLDLRATFERPSGDRSWVHWSSDGRQLLDVGFKGAFAWDPMSGQRLKIAAPELGGGLRAKAASHTGKLLAVSIDKDLVTFDLTNGRTRRAPHEHEPLWPLITVDRDAARIVTGGWDGVLVVRDARTLKVQRKVTGLRRVSAFAWSPDGRRLAVAHGAKERRIDIFDTRRWTSVLSWELPNQKHRQIWKETSWLAWTPDGAHLVGDGKAEVVTLWDAKTGELAREVPLPTRPGNFGGPKWGRPLIGALSPDGRVVMVAFETTLVRVPLTEGAAATYRAPSKRSSGRFVLGPGGDHDHLATIAGQRTRLWDLRRGGPPKVIEGSPGRSGGLQGEVLTAHVFRPDGSAIATRSRLRVEHSWGVEDKPWGPAKLWSVPEGELIRELPLPETIQGVHALGFTADGRYLLGSAAPLPCKWGRRQGLLPADERCPGWKLLAWDAKTGDLVRQIDNVAREGDGGLLIGGITPDGSAFMCVREGKLEVWDLRTWKRRATVEGIRGSSADLQASGRWVLHRRYRGGSWTQIRDIESGQLIKRIGTTDVVFSKDGRHVAYAGGTRVEVWDLEANQLAWAFDDNRRPWGFIDGTDAVVTGLYGAVKVFRRTPAGGGEKVWESPLAVRATHPGGKRLYVSRTGPSATGAGVQYDLERGEIPIQSTLHQAPSAAAYSADGRYLLLSALDGLTHLVDSDSGKEIVAIGDLGPRSWIVARQDGLFDASPGAEGVLEWRIGGRTFALDQFYNAFYTPGLLARALRGDKLASRLDLSTVRPPPEVRIVSPSHGERTKEGKVRVIVNYKARGGGVSRTWLYLNGHRVHTTRGLRRFGGERRVFEVELVEGRNHLRATAFDASGSVESVGDEIVIHWDTPVAEKPALHILAVGVDHYRAGINLRFAGADAKAIAAHFRPGLFGRVEPTVLVDEQATRAGILRALDAIAAEAAPRDAVLVYLAGHGTLVGQGFYFLPHDARVEDDAAIRASAIAQSALGDALTRIKATKQILVLDACHSGATAGALGRMLARRDALTTIRAQQRLARSSGAFLIAASTAEQYAKEIPALGHGVLTSAILAGLGASGAPPKAPANAHGHVTVNALLGYLAEEVPRLTKQYHGGRQEPVQASTGQDFPLGLAR